MAVVAADPALDGIRLDDLTFGPKGESLFAGAWIGPAQAERLADAPAPKLAELTKGAIGRPIAWNMKDTPTDRWLRELRQKVVNAAFDDTSLDRLFFRPVATDEPKTELTLEGATTEPIRGAVEKQLGEWVKDDPLAAAVGTPVLQLATRPASLLGALRKLVADAPTLDGVRLDHGLFDQENVYVISGVQDHDGQAEHAAALRRAAAAAAWPKVSPPSARAGTFGISPLLAALERLRWLLPYYPQGDNVLLKARITTPTRRSS